MRSYLCNLNEAGCDGQYLRRTVSSALLRRLPVRCPANDIQSGDVMSMIKSLIAVSCALGRWGCWLIEAFEDAPKPCGNFQVRGTGQGLNREKRAFMVSINLACWDRKLGTFPLLLVQWVYAIVAGFIVATLSA